MNRYQVAIYRYSISIADPLATPLAVYAIDANTDLTARSVAKNMAAQEFGKGLRVRTACRLDD